MNSLINTLKEIAFKLITFIAALMLIACATPQELQPVDFSPPPPLPYIERPSDPMPTDQELPAKPVKKLKKRGHK